MGDGRGDRKRDSPWVAVVAAGLAAGLVYTAVDSLASRRSKDRRHLPEPQSPPSFRRLEGTSKSNGRVPERKERSTVTGRSLSSESHLRRRDDAIIKTAGSAASEPLLSTSRRPLPLMPPTRELLPNRRSPAFETYDERPTPRRPLYQDIEAGKQELRYLSQGSSTASSIYSAGQHRQSAQINGNSLEEGNNPWEGNTRPNTPVQRSSASYSWYPDYRYTKLPSSGMRIRLVQLHPGQGDEALACSFYEYALHLSERGNGQYEAVSYSWGTDRTTDCLLYCDNHPRGPPFPPQPDNLNVGVLRITKSAEAVLQRFRKATEEVVLWLDAICLNQEDDDEKHYQLRHMADIYMKAKCVLVWLDDRAMIADQDSDIVERTTEGKSYLYTDGEKCMQFFNRFGQWSLQAEKAQITDLRDADHWRRHYLFETFEDYSGEKLAKFFRYIRWFSRRW
jgi:hypothetical protein